MGGIASQILKGRVCIQVWDEQDLIDSFFSMFVGIVVFANVQIKIVLGCILVCRPLTQISVVVDK